MGKKKNKIADIKAHLLRQKDKYTKLKENATHEADTNTANIKLGQVEEGLAELDAFQQANNGNNGGQQQPQGMQPQHQMPDGSMMPGEQHGGQQGMPMGNPGMGQPQFSRNGGHLNMYDNGGYSGYDNDGNILKGFDNAASIATVAAPIITGLMKKPEDSGYKNGMPGNNGYTKKNQYQLNNRPYKQGGSIPMYPNGGFADYGTMAAKFAPIASDIYDSHQKVDYAKAQRHPYEGDILGGKPNLIDYNSQLAELRRQQEATNAAIPGMSGGSAQQALLATSASGLGYGDKMADAIRQNQLQNAMIKNQYDQERRGNLMNLGNFDVQQNAMEGEERRMAEATGRNFRRSAVDKVAQFATVEEEKAYQMGTLEDLYANYNYNPSTKKWEYKG